MVLTDTMNYHANHIGAIQTHKEHLKTIYNVDIHITRRRFGEYQEVDITGSTNDIRACKTALKYVAEEAEFAYQEYLERKRRRDTIKPKREFKLPTQIVSKKRVNANPFSALEGLDEEAEAREEEGREESGEEAEAESYEQSFPSLYTYDPNISWGDMSDDE
jgi:hypothetical protein